MNDEKIEWEEESKKYYKYLTNKKDKKMMVKKLAEGLPNNHIKCRCGKIFHSDNSEEYILRILGQKPKINLLKSTALAKWIRHVEDLKRDIDTNHKWIDVKSK